MHLKFGIVLQPFANMIRWHQSLLKDPVKICIMHQQHQIIDAVRMRDVVLLAEHCAKYPRESVTFYVTFCVS